MEIELVRMVDNRLNSSGVGSFEEVSRRFLTNLYAMCSLFWWISGNAVVIHWNLR